MTKSLVLDVPTLQALIRQWNALSPTGPMGKPEELMSIVVYLANDTASCTTEH